MKIISQTVVHLYRPDRPGLGAYRSALFAEGSGNVPQQLQNLKQSLEEGFAIKLVEVVGGEFELDCETEKDAIDRVRRNLLDKGHDFLMDEIGADSLIGEKWARFVNMVCR